jgi:type III pantothenate kinase
VNVVIDIGNTSSKVATFKNNKLIELQACMANEVIQLLSSIKFEKGIVSSVKEDEFSAEIVNQYPSIIKLTQELKNPVVNAYSTTQSLGHDRLANAVGAYAIEAGRNSLIIDAGTCLKFDFIDDQNRYLGGSISPGLLMRLKSLHTFTDKLPLVALKKPKSLIGDSTTESLLSGVVNGIKSEIINMINEYQNNHPQLKVFFTGGDLDFLYPMVDKQKSSIFAHNYITLLGLNRILQENVS